VRIGGEDGPVRFIAEDVDRWLDQARAAWTPGHLVRSQEQVDEATRSHQRRVTAVPGDQQSLL
jgi:hypothetical protein